MKDSDVNDVKIALVGLGGYGQFYLKRFLAGDLPNGCRLVAGVDPNPPETAELANLRGQGVPIHASLADLFASAVPDLVILATPIPLHCPMTVQALEAGCHVLCEKPVAATIQELERMREARDQAGRLVGIGYQLSFTPGIQTLKHDIATGLLGRPKQLKTLVLWPRDEAYYGRNCWAGRIRDERGNLVLDSPVSNATAHYLHNMLYVLGQEVDRCAAPSTVAAELYRANPIQNYDSAALRVMTSAGTELLFYTAHATDQTCGPQFFFQFEKATVRCDEDQQIVATMADGATKVYGGLNDEPHTKVWQMASAIRGGGRVHCGLEASSGHLKVMNGAQESGEPVTVPAELVKVAGETGKRLTYVQGLADIWKRSFDQGVLPHELGDVPWTVVGRTVDLAGYRQFPSGR